jgi:hypothetical protein
MGIGTGPRRQHLRRGGVGLALFTALFCSQNTVQLMAAGTVRGTHLTPGSECDPTGGGGWHSSALDGVVHQGNRMRAQQMMTDERDVMARGNYKAIPPSALAKDGASAFAAMSPKWVGLSLPWGVRLVGCIDRTMLDVINWCFGCHSRQPGCQIGYMDPTGCHQLVF